MMNTSRRNKIIQIIILLTVLAVALGLVLYALRQNISLFYSPTELTSAQHVPHNHMIRLGGLVREGSLRHGQHLRVHFLVTDGTQSIPVVFTGVLPDLFREGKSTVAEGIWTGRVFKAQRVLAKHDENYMPAAVKDALRTTT